ncbi:GspE/PulE family protein, partial [Hydrogenophaga sp.]|uniref:GspE/PulE family protein n=1 Tax=Hydrogenophaga sp. TaxID=1904254 RepID=UPI003565BB20
STEVVVATAEPFVRDWVDELERQTRRSVRLVLASPAAISRYTAEFFALAKSVRAANKSGAQGAFSSFEQLVELGKGNKQLDANDQGVVQVVDWLWQYAFDQRASDIHLEPRREQGVIRFRIDGVLHPVYQMPMGVMGAMIARIKLLGRMDVVEKRRPQDGRIKTLRPAPGGGTGTTATGAARGDEVEMRLSTLPTAFGEKLVMRIFDPDTTVKDLSALGFAAHDAQRWEELTRRPHGIVLVTGPTGSGKTTTLYATLKRLATEEVNVSTVEDPIEMIEPAFNQTQVQAHLDLDFIQGLRALMRQDPDIIMVGEVRDLATAEMAVQAALTGHLVFTTLHTNDAPSAVMRLMELGIPPYLINATVLGVLAQRLVRTLCPACRTREDETQASVSRAALTDLVKPWSVSGKYRPYEPVGCVECRMTGFRGRMGLYELLTVTEAFKEKVSREPQLDVLRKQAVADGMRPLRLAGAVRVAEGLTTMEEVLSCTPPVQ